MITFEVKNSKPNVIIKDLIILQWDSNPDGKCTIDVKEEYQQIASLEMHNILFLTNPKPMPIFRILIQSCKINFKRWVNKIKLRKKK